MIQTPKFDPWRGNWLSSQINRSRVWIMVWRFWSDPPNVWFLSPYWSILSFLIKWSMILRTTDPCSSDFYLCSHSDPNLIPQYLRITGPFDVRSNLILPLIPEYFKNLILEWFLAMILNSPDPDLIFIPKANYHRIRIFAPENYSGFSMHSMDLCLFYFLISESWILTHPTSGMRSWKLFPDYECIPWIRLFLLDPWILDPHKSNSSSLLPDFMILLPECLQKGSIWEVNTKSHKNQC